MIEDFKDHFAREDPKNIPERIRRQVLERDGYQCQYCGTSGENRLQLHHVVYRSQGGKHLLENLVTLCFEHHEAVHRGWIRIVLIEVEPGVVMAFPAKPHNRNGTT